MGETPKLAGISLIGLLQGFGLGAGLIIATGTQNAFVLRQEADRFGYAYVDMASDFPQRLAEAEMMLTAGV